MNSSVYTEIILELYKNPLNKGRIDGADIEASGGNPVCGDQSTFYLKVKDGKVEDARFYGSGCAISIASASLLSEMVKGMKISELKKISGERIFSELGGIIQTRIKCALLGLEVLKKGVESYEKSGRKRVVVRGIVV